MTKLSVKQKVASVLMQNSYEFLSIQEIARLAYKDAYMKETKKHLEGLVKRNMSHAIALLSEEGFLVIKDLERCRNGVKMTHKGVKGYKIADKEDSEILKINLKTKKQRLQIAEQIKFDFQSLVDTNNLIDKQ